MSTKRLKALQEAMMASEYEAKAETVIVDDAASLKKLRAFWADVPTWIGCDTETIGLDPWQQYVYDLSKPFQYSDTAITVIQYFDGEYNIIVNVPRLQQRGIWNEFRDFVKPIHENQETAFSFFNGVFDIKMLWATGLYTENANCLMLGAKMCERKVNTMYPSLKNVAKNWLNFEMDKSVRASFLTPEARIGEFTKDQIEYAKHDVEVLAPIYRIVYSTLAESAELDAWEINNRALQGTAFFELGGVPIDYAEFQELLEIDRQVHLDMLAEKARLGLSNVNLNSSMQLKELYKTFGIELTNTQKGTLEFYKNTNEVTAFIAKFKDHMAKITEKKDKTFLAPQYKNKYIPRNYEYAYSSIEFLFNPTNRKALLRQYGELPTKTTLKKLDKQLTESGICVIDHDGVKIKQRIKKGNYNMLGMTFPEMQHDKNLFLWRFGLKIDGAATGRYSSSGSPTMINGQNIPSESRACTDAPPGFVVVGADYSFIELQIVAVNSGETKLIEAINKGVDIHKFSAGLVFDCAMDEVTPKMRKSVKAIVFGLLYGQTIFALSEALGLSLEEAQKLQTKYFDTFTNVRDYINQRMVEARYTGKIRLSSGGFRYLSMNKRSYASELRKSIQREAKNAPMQGDCAVIIKMAAGYLAREIHEHNLINKVIAVGMVHDEIAMFCPKEYATLVRDLLAKSMNRATKEMLPGITKDVSVDVARQWSKESFDGTLLAYANDKMVASDVDEVIIMCFGKHTIEYQFWTAMQNKHAQIKEFFATIDSAKYEPTSIEHKMQQKLI